MRSSIEISASNSLLISSTGVDIFASGDLDDYFQFSVTSDRPLFTAMGNYLVIGKDATTGHSLDADDVLFGEDIEVDGIAYLDGGATFADTKSIDAGSTTDDYLVGKAFDTGGSMTEIWRMVGAAEPYFATGSSQSNKFYHDGTVTLGGVVTMGANLEVGTIDIDDDSGAVTLVDMGVTGDPAAGTEESVAFAIDGNNFLKLYTEADSSGGIQNSRLNLYQDVVVTAGKTLAGQSLVVEAHTENDTLTLAESGSVHTNLGDAGAQTIKLPASATVGTYFIFALQVAQAVNVEIGESGGKFYQAGVITTDDTGNDLIITADDEGESITLMSDGAAGWFVIAEAGTWTVSQP